jgi:hypothetical protein
MYKHHSSEWANFEKTDKILISVARKEWFNSNPYKIKWDTPDFSCTNTKFNKKFLEQFQRWNIQDFSTVSSLYAPSTKHKWKKRTYKSHIPKIFIRSQVPFHNLNFILHYGMIWVGIYTFLTKYIYIKVITDKQVTINYCFIPEKLRMLPTEKQWHWEQTIYQLAFTICLKS